MLQIITSVEKFRKKIKAVHCVMAVLNTQYRYWCDGIAGLSSVKT